MKKAQKSILRLAAAFSIVAVGIWLSSRQWTQEGNGNPSVIGPTAGNHKKSRVPPVEAHPVPEGIFGLSRSESLRQRESLLERIRNLPDQRQRVEKLGELAAIVCDEDVLAGLGILEEAGIGKLRAVAVGRLLEFAFNDVLKKIVDALQEKGVREDISTMIGWINYPRTMRPSNILTDVAESAKDSRLKSAFAAKVGEQLTNRNEVASLMSTSKDDILKEEVLRGFSRALFSRSSGESLASLVEQFPDQYKAAIDGALTIVLDTSTPEAGLLEVTKLGPEFRPEGIRVLASRWMVADSVAASNWVKTLPEGGERDHAILGMVPSLIAHQDYSSAKEWIDVVTDIEIRKELTGMIPDKFLAPQ